MKLLGGFRLQPEGCVRRANSDELQRQPHPSAEQVAEKVSLAREKAEARRENSSISPFCLLPYPFRLRFSAAC
jgi:hypothetical protein